MKVVSSVYSLDFEGNPDWVLDVVANCDENRLAVSLGSKSIGIHDASSLERVFSVYNAHSGRINDINYSSTDPNLIITCSNDKYVKCWDQRSSSSSGAALQFRFSDEVESVSIGMKDSLIAAAISNSVCFADSRKSQAGGADGSRPTKLLGEYGDIHTDTITDVKFHPERTNELFTASEDGLICCYDTHVSENCDAVLSIMNTDCPVRTFGFYGQNKEGMFCLSTVETATFWHIYTALRISSLPQVRETHGADYLVNCFAEEDEVLLLAGRNDGDAMVLTVTPDATRKVDTARGGHTEVIRGAVRLRDGRVVTGGEDSKMVQFQ